MILNFKFGVPRRPDGITASGIIFFAYPSMGQLPVAPTVQALTGNQALTLPVNCVTIGEQRPNKEAMGLHGISGALKGIFNER